MTLHLMGWKKLHSNSWGKKWGQQLFNFYPHFCTTIDIIQSFNPYPRILNTFNIKSLKFHGKTIYRWGVTLKTTQKVQKTQCPVWVETVRLCTGRVKLSWLISFCLYSLFSKFSSMLFINTRKVYLSNFETKFKYFLRYSKLKPVQALK